MRNFVSFLITLGIAVLFMLIRGLPSSINPLSAVLTIAVLFVIVRGLMALLGAMSGSDQS